MAYEMQIWFLGTTLAICHCPVGVSVSFNITVDQIPEKINLRRGEVCLCPQFQRQNPEDRSVELLAHLMAARK